MELNEIRSKIDTTDEQLLSLFLKRMELSSEVAQQKKLSGLPVLNKERERQILADVTSKSGNMEQYTHRFFTSLFELSRAYQNSIINSESNVSKIIDTAASNTPHDNFPKSGIIACQGIEGANSQMAADRLFPRGNIVYFKTFEAVFDAVNNGLCEFGILPIENSSVGSVREVYELMRKKKVNIVRSTRLWIKHELLAKPGTKLSDITAIYSHEQAISQCSEFLKSLGSEVKVIPCSNTAVAAQMVAASDDKSIAAISSHNCAAIYGLETINDSIQNNDNNYTRFICISQKPMIFPGANRISLILSEEHRPGSLYEILAHFSALGINLLKIESCPMAGHDFEFIFFFELEASVHDKNVVSMLSSLEQKCEQFQFLGNYQEV